MGCGNAENGGKVATVLWPGNEAGGSQIARSERAELRQVFGAELRHDLGSPGNLARIDATNRMLDAA